MPEPNQKQGSIVLLAAKGNAERVQMGTIDAIATALRDHMEELGKEVPADLWCKLLVQEEVETEDLPKASAPAGGVKVRRHRANALG